ncbi:MAG: hypothetical protein L0Y58_24150 [Verrucomicrobia subdivision 3 bacterium]|nr:hypothetical protein [Limisphaerales bacterium]
MKALRALFVLALATRLSPAAEFGIESAGHDGTITWSGAYTAGVITVQTKGSLLAPWSLPSSNYFTSNLVGSAAVPLSPTQSFVRLLAVDISTNTTLHYTNLLQSYGVLETVAGRGEFNGDKINYWRATNEGGFATNAQLSRPHIAFGDPRNDDVLIVDEGSSSVLRVTPDGRIYTYAGTHTNGFNGDGPAPATNLHLNWPNGGWMRGDGTLFVLDTYNGKLRKIDTNGMMNTLFTTAPLGDGRALWVRSDEALVYFGSGQGFATTLNQWTPTGGVRVVRSDFGDLGNMMGDERTGDLYLSDRNANRVYRMDTNFTLIPIAGNGTQSGGGEGFPALQTGLILPRSVWFIPNGGYFIGEHDPGNRIWYVDPAGIIHRWMNGSSANNRRVGDGQWFYANPSQAKVSRVRSVTTDRAGNILIVESNYGYVRRIRFQRLTP